MWKKVKNFWKEAPRKYPNAPLYIAGAAVVHYYFLVLGGHLQQDLGLYVWQFFLVN